MLGSLITTFLFASLVLAAPSPQPGYKQTTREAVSNRLANREKGIARRQATSPRPYSRCDTSGPVGEGSVFARYDSSITFTSGTFLETVAGTSVDDCTNQCAQRPTCQAAYFFAAADPDACFLYSSYGDLAASNLGISFRGNDCASLAVQYPDIASAACCNYWTTGSTTVSPP